MKTSKGVIQGYVGISAVDSKHQVVVSAEAYGQGQEHGLLEQMVEQIEEAFKEDYQSPLKEDKKRSKWRSNIGFYKWSGNYR